MRSNIPVITAAAMTVALALAALGGAGASAKQDSEGCTPGYWKQSDHLDSWGGVSPGDDFEAVFGVDASFTATLLGVVQQGGGGERALGRHSVAAYLNSASPDVDFLYTEAEVIVTVQDAYASGDYEGAKDLLADANAGSCPLA